MSISNTDDYIDGGAACNELDERRSEIEDVTESLTEQQEILKDLDAEEDAEEYAATVGLITNAEEKIQELTEEMQPLVDLEEDIYYFALSDVSLIKATAFEDYCMRFAIDCGDVSEHSGVFAYIDWDGYAQGMQIDYTSVTFDDEEYLYRS